MTMRFIFILFSLCSCFFLSSSLHASDSKQDRALSILMEKLETTGYYQKRLKLTCLSFIDEKTTAHHVEFAVHEKHDGKSCAGDPNTAPLVDRFRVELKTKKIERYIAAEAMFMLFEFNAKP